MLLGKLKEMNRECTGCAACCSVCPHEAIRMEPDEEGFFKPDINEEKCINCELCERTCPQLNMRNDNFENPACYAVKADEEILKVSSSGGAFTILADYVFARNGYVCGAAYDEDFKGVSHIMISDAKDMYKLRGSKYVYSKPGNIYRQVKEKLLDDQYVLFSGTPCQVAALNNILNRKYEKLITVDLLCGGVPSENIFKQYIEEVSDGKKIKSVNFRPKKYGWSYSGIEIIFEDGTDYMLHSVNDPYLKGFLNWLYVGNSCANCQFAPTPRQGDFSIGDFWNISRYSDELYDRNGVSCLLINNKTAGMIFERVRDRFVFAERVPLSFLKRFNRMQPGRKHHLARSRFFDLIRRGYSLDKAVDYALNWKFDVALSGCWTVPNYGGHLTYYALYKTLNKMGYTVIMVERRADIPNYNVPGPTLFSQNPYPFYDVCAIAKTFEKQQELNIRVRNFIVGSDQILNCALFRFEAIKSFYLDYVTEYRKKIAYAASFGDSVFHGNEQQKSELKSILKTFDFVSSREDSGVELFDKVFEISAEQVLDPVLLCDKAEYDNLINKSKSRISGPYLFTYYHPDSEDYYTGLEKLGDKLNYGIVNTLRNEFTSTGSYDFLGNVKCEDWLYYLSNSRLVVADSFHAICFSIIYKIPFVCVVGTATEKSGGLDRIKTLLTSLNLQDRIVKTVQELLEKKIYLSEIDYDAVHDILNRERERSLNWLKNAIESKKQVV